MKKTFVGLLIAVILLFCACSSDNATVLNVNKSKNYKLTFVCPIVENEYWYSCVEGMEKADEELGTQTKVIGPKTADNYNTEIIKFMQQAINEKPDGIIAYAGIEEMFPLIEKASKAGIPVLAVDSDAESTSRIAYVGTDAYNAGYKAGEEMIRLTGGTAKIGLMISSKSAEKEIIVVDAFKDAVDDYEIDIVCVEETYADPDTAEEKARAMLNEHPDISAIFNTAGYNVTGAARVKKELGKDDLILIGFDDIEENLAFIREGIINTILVQNIRQAGYQSVCLMKEYLDKGALPEKIYDTGTMVVTKENVETYRAEPQGTTQNSKTVRVGYYKGDTAFQDGFSDEERKSGYAYEYYQAIAAVAGWDYEYFYGTRKKMLDMLADGAIDIVAGVYKTRELEEYALISDEDMSLSGEKRYFAVNSNRHDLLEELNFAMNLIATFTPDFTINITQKYYSQAAQQVLTDAEKEWLKEKGVIKIGYIKNCLPISDCDSEDQPIGLIEYILELLGENIRIDVEPVCFDNISDLISGLKSNKIDAAFPIYSDLWINEKQGLRQTVPIISDKIMVLYSGNYSSDLFKKIALAETGIGQKQYIETYYADSEMIYFETSEDAFDAIQKRKDICIIGCSSIIQRFLRKNPKYQNLNVAYLDTSEEFSIALDSDDSPLQSIFNKIIRCADDAAVTSSMLKYSSIETNYTLEDFFNEYALFFIGFLSLFISIMVLFFILYLRRNRIFKREQTNANIALEKALKTANAANEAKTTFLSSISHDIRTPMNAIIGMTTIAHNYIDNKEKITDCLNKIDLSGRYLLTLVNNVLDISKIESGQLQLNPIIFSLKNAAETLAGITHQQAKAKKISLEMNIHNIIHDTVYADEVRVNQIFVNILSNSVKYTPDGGKVTIDLSQESLPDKSKVRVIYSVSDTGIGMSAEFMETMYDTFSRAKDSRINKIQGTGLGLAIVKQMVEMMDGTIDCESIENVGTKFTVTLDLPIRDIDENDLFSINDHNSQTGVNNMFTGKRFLIAEDNELNWEVISELLNIYSIYADRASNGKECVEILKNSEEGKYSIVLMDIQMPEMNGRDATKLIRNDPREYVRNIPVIAMTADAFAEDIAACLDAGIDGHVSKPVDMDKLFQELKRVTERKVQRKDI